MEIPGIFGGLFEVDRPSFPTSAIKTAQGFDVVRVCDGTAHSASLEPIPDESNNESIQSRLRLGPENTYLVTGGTRGMGLEIATWLVERGARNLILLSRQGMPVTEKGSKPDAGAEKFLSQKSALEAKGVAVHVLAIDMGKPEAGPQLRDAIARLGLPPVKGVVHAAGLAAYHTLDRCTPAGMAEVLAPKVLGGLALDALFPPRTLDFFALMSSMGQLVGFEGQLAYAPANAFLDGLAARRRRQGDNCTAILWSTWRGVGMAAQSKSATRMIDRGMRDRGFAAISAEEAFTAWDRIASLDTDHAVVVRALEATTDGSRPHPMLKHITPSELALRGERGTRDSAQWKQTAIEYPDDAVAVVGMACQTAAGETAEDLWHVLLEGKSMTRREAAALDPHQRLLLQTTYHALESAGWVGGDQQEPETHKTPGPTTSTGCFIGMNAPDWPLNLASHPASPYTGTGMLRSFAAGRLSHHFGWTGPSQTVDTACSSAMVAVHQACRALRLGECTRAVAGGANLLTNPALSEALRAGGFLSATDGPCKPFDARGDGYCRGEAVGVVVLKPLSAARRDGDDVLGVLLATGNNQNVNSTSITNPVLESQAALYRDVLGRAGVRPQDISYVEAHGTGTKAGDPVEMGGIRQVLGGKDRASTLHIGAVKANVGHAEAAAGVVSLIKVLLMMRYGKITPQAQFKSLNPNIQPLENDGLAIATSLRGWNDGMRLALVNSFGASGNNAAAIVAPPPLKEAEPAVSSTNSESTSASFPIIISASSTTSLSSYCEKLKAQIEDLSFAPTLPDLAFALATRRSRQHQQLFCTTTKSLGELQTQLSSPEKFTSVAQRPRPVVLLFSGQNGNTVPPARPLYDSSALFQKHLHQCDEALKLLGFPSLFPAVLEGFQGDSDIVLRHAAMFAIQYSSGMSWLDSGLQSQAVCGHSFGEWAAATVSGVMTLDAGMRLVTGYWITLMAKAKKAMRRASIIQKLWGDDTGSMIAIEAELVKKDITPEKHLEPFLKQHPETKASVACYNGPNHYVAAGPTPDIELLEAYMKDRKSSGEAMRFKVLKGMHAYHCAVADPIVEESGKLSSTIPYQEPTLPFEPCNPDTWTGPASNVIASNTRGPVYFTQTIARVVDRLGPSTFLESGFGGPIVAMARNALSQTQSQHTFVAIDGKKPAQSLADATATLWKNGQPEVQYWPFHKSQRGSYTAAVLPPYQFEKNRHWLDYVPRLEGDNAAKKPVGQEALAPLGQCPHCLKHASDVPYIVQDKSSSRANADTSVFKVDARSRRYQELIGGHVVVGTPICPASMYMELATLAVTSLKPTAMNSEITVDSLAIKAPLSLDTQRAISLAVTKRSETAWEFEVSSTKGSERLTSHATGTVNLGGNSSSILNDDQSDDWDKWARMGRLLEKDTDTDALRGAMVYKVFSAMAQYSPVYKGLKHLVGKGAEAAGDISMPALDLDPAARAPNDSIADTVVVDNFLQVPGAFVHSLRRGAAGEGGEEDGGMSFICTGMGSAGPLNWQSPSHGGFRVYTKAIAESSNKVTLNMFALDKATQKTVWSAKGLQFSKVPRSSLAKAVMASEIKPDLVLSGVREILAKSLDVPMDEIAKQATLEDLGADSLVSPEILASISSKFGIDITSDEFASATNVALLCALVSSTIGGSGKDSEEGQEPEMVPPAVHIETATVCQDAVSKSLGDSLDVPVEEIQMDSKLEDLGVDSLISGEIISRLNEALNVDITSSELASATDVASLCQLITESLDSGSSVTPQSQSTVSTTSTRPGTPPPGVETPLTENEKPSATKRTSPAKATSMLLHRGSASAAKTRSLFLVPDGFGSGAVFGPLAPLLARVTDVSVYALNSPYLTRDNQPADLDLDLPPTLEQLAALYVAELRRRQPEGPYLLGGYSVGGLVAYEMARQLLEDGCAVEKVFLIDTVCPTLATSLPDTLVDFFESIGSHLGVANEDEVRAKNGGRLLTSRHFTLARHQLARYQVKSGLPGGQKERPQFVLFSAREGLDKQSAIARPTLSVEGERKMAEWFLDDRSEISGALGWEEFLGSPVRVERADGNHFSMMTPQMVSGWGSKLAELLE
ncbi:polyketide synthase [Apiospora aurea]|uniref:Polyketide synthase n=1 Tax=Apiospora aurea TaxID=335848 RepID=A0ABR1PXK3_9PEZI